MIIRYVDEPDFEQHGECCPMFGCKKKKSIFDLPPDPNGQSVGHSEVMSFESTSGPDGSVSQSKSSSSGFMRNRNGGKLVVSKNNSGPVVRRRHNPILNELDSIPYELKRRNRRKRHGDIGFGLTKKLGDLIEKRGRVVLRYEGMTPEEVAAVSRKGAQKAFIKRASATMALGGLGTIGADQASRMVQEAEDRHIKARNRKEAAKKAWETRRRNGKDAMPIELFMLMRKNKRRVYDAMLKHFFRSLES